MLSGVYSIEPSNFQRRARTNSLSVTTSYPKLNSWKSAWFARKIGGQFTCHLTVSYLQRRGYLPGTLTPGPRNRIASSRIFSASSWPALLKICMTEARTLRTSSNADSLFEISASRLAWESLENLGIFLNRMPMAAPSSMLCAPACP